MEGTIMKGVVVSEEEKDLLEKLDKGIDDLENGRITAHEDAMKILKQRYDSYVLQSVWNRWGFKRFIVDYDWKKVVILRVLSQKQNWWKILRLGCFYHIQGEAI